MTVPKLIEAAKRAAEWLEHETDARAATPWCNLGIARANNLRAAIAAEEAKPRVTVPTGQTSLNENLGHHLLDVFKEGQTARESGTASPYHGHSLEHCLHAAGWVQKDLSLALKKARDDLAAEEARQSGADSARVEGMDEAADFIFDGLMKALGVSGFSDYCDGTETWEGDVSGTLYNILRAAGVLDEDNRLMVVSPVTGGALHDALRGLVGEFTDTADNILRPFHSRGMTAAASIAALADAYRYCSERLVRLLDEQAAPAQICDCERSHNGLGISGRECDCADCD